MLENEENKQITDAKWKSCCHGFDECHPKRQCNHFSLPKRVANLAKLCHHLPLLFVVGQSLWPSCLDTTPLAHMFAATNARFHRSIRIFHCHEVRSSKHRPPNNSSKSPIANDSDNSFRCNRFVTSCH